MKDMLALQRILADSRLYFAPTNAGDAQARTHDYSPAKPAPEIGENEWDPYLVWYRNIRINC